MISALGTQYEGLINVSATQDVTDFVGWDDTEEMASEMYENPSRIACAECVGT